MAKPLRKCPVQNILALSCLNDSTGESINAPPAKTNKVSAFKTEIWKDAPVTVHLHCYHLYNYKSLVQPMLDMVWNSFQKNLKSDIEIMQRRAATYKMHLPWIQLLNKCLCPHHQIWTATAWNLKKGWEGLHDIRSLEQICWHHSYNQNSSAEQQNHLRSAVEALCTILQDLYRCISILSSLLRSNSLCGWPAFGSPAVCTSLTMDWTDITWPRSTQCQSNRRKGGAHCRITRFYAVFSWISSQESLT